MIVLAFIYRFLKEMLQHFLNYFKLSHDLIVVNDKFYINDVLV
jgi:hypothetical protein